MTGQRGLSADKAPGLWLLVRTVLAAAVLLCAGAPHSPGESAKHNIASDVVSPPDDAGDQLAAVNASEQTAALTVGGAAPTHHSLHGHPAGLAPCGVASNLHLVSPGVEDASMGCAAATAGCGRTVSAGAAWVSDAGGRSVLSRFCVSRT